MTGASLARLDAQQRRTDRGHLRLRADVGEDAARDLQLVHGRLEIAPLFVGKTDGKRDAGPLLVPVDVLQDVAGALEERERLIGFASRQRDAAEGVLRRPDTLRLSVWLVQSERFAIETLRLVEIVL